MRLFYFWGWQRQIRNATAKGQALLTSPFRRGVDDFASAIEARCPDFLPPCALWGQPAEPLVMSCYVLSMRR